jgi:hypothetical protein
MHFHLASRIATLVVALAAAPVLAVPSSVTPQSFTSTHRAEVNATPAAVYAAIGQIGQWWNGQHTYSGNPENLSLDLRAGGCWCEQWDGGSVQHARVLYAARDKALRLEGGLGPLQDMAVSAVMTYAIAVADGKTVLTLTYRVRGADASLDKLAPIVDQVVGEGFARLVAFAGKAG